MENGKATQRKTHRPVEEKLYAVKQVIYLNRHRVNVAIKMQISTGTLNNWLKRYQLEGTEELHPKRDNQLKENRKEEFARL